MRGLTTLLCATAMLAPLALMPTGRSQAVIEVGIQPVCAYGYYDYAPLSVRASGLLRPGYFYNGIFLGMGPAVVEEDDITVEVVLRPIAHMPAAVTIPPQHVATYLMPLLAPQLVVRAQLMLPLITPRPRMAAHRMPLPTPQQRVAAQLTAAAVHPTGDTSNR